MKGASQATSRLSEKQYHIPVGSARNCRFFDERRELLEAMRAIAAGGLAPANQVPSMGCSIKWRATPR
jgi:hypothetical protein